MPNGRQGVPNGRRGRQQWGAHTQRNATDSDESVGCNESFELIEKVRSNETVGPVKIGQ